MVYRGKLAAGCSKCIQRRIRCDQRVEGCSQCRRIGVLCSGYRSENDRTMAAHLNQTTETMRRHGGRALALDSRAPKGEVEPLPLAIGIAPPPAQDLEAIALAYCCHRHIIPPAPSIVKDAKLLACMKALGLASYSNVARSNQLHMQALEYYSVALNSVNTALACPANAIKDSTLLSVFLLSCYEFTTRGSLLEFLRGWTTHVQGLCTLIRMRGPQQLKSIEGRYLFLLSCSFILRDHMRSGVLVPTDVADMLEHISDRDTRWRPLLLLLKVADLRVAANNGAMTDPNVVVERARTIDQKLSSVYCDMPDSFDFQTFDWHNEPGSLLPSYVYIYRSSAAAMLWNSIRAARIACHSLIVEVLLEHPETSVDLHLDIEVSRSIIHCMQLDMLASVPHALGMAGENPLDVIAGLSDKSSSNHNGWPVTTFVPNRDLVNGNLPILALTRGYALTFQLASAGGLAGTNGLIRRAFCKALRFIGTHMGFSVALLFAGALEGEQDAGGIVDRHHAKLDAKALDYSTTIVN